MLTNGVKNTINKDDGSIKQFWELNKLSKLQKPYNKIRTQEQMIDIAKLVIENQEIKPDDKYYNYVLRFSKAEIITNNFGKKLYIKLGDI